MKVTKDMMIAEVLADHEELVPIFLQHGLFCLGCAMSHGETLEEACEVHGLDLEDLLDDLNDFLGDEEEA